VMLTEDQRRIGIAMRELRRGAAMAKFRERIYGAETDVLDIAQHDALEVVVALGEARMGDLASALRVDPSTATRTVARLESAGLVERRRADGDARAVVVVPTRGGTALYERRAERAREALTELFDHFGVDEQRQLADLLDRLVAGLDELAGLPRASVSG